LKPLWERKGRKNTLRGTETLLDIIVKNRDKKLHVIKGFVIPTKSFVKIGLTKIFCYNNKMLY